MTRKRTSRRGRGRGPRVQSTFGRRAPSRPLSGQMKAYTFDFTLQPQILSASQTTIASLVLGGREGGQLKPIGAVRNLPSAASSAFGATFQDFAFSCSHAFADLTSIAQWVNQYDAYRINHVTMVMEYMSNVAQPAAVIVLPTVYYYQDQDDANLPVNTLTLYAKQGVQSWQPNATDTTLSFRYKPRVSVFAATSSVDQGNLVAKAGQWLNCQDANVAHFGVKAVVTDFCSPGQPNFSHGFRIHFKYNISFRAPLQCY